MAKKLKDYYDLDCVKLLAEKICVVRCDMDQIGFTTYLSQELEDKEFYGRQDAFVAAFDKYLGSNYAGNIRTFEQILGPELINPEGMFKIGWWLWPIGRYVERFGLQDFEVSIGFIYELTKRFTGEFAIRPLIAEYPVGALQTMLKWSQDSNVHVRRLSSEGLRISLPWAKKSLAAIKTTEDFETYKHILTNLKNDPAKFVQKSVGNNLNDLIKVRPDLALQIIQEWQVDNPSKETLWIIKHGLRSQKLSLKISNQQLTS